MTGTDIVNTVAEKVEQPRYLVKEIIECAYQEILQAIFRDETVEIRRFGTFRPKTLRRGRLMSNPRTGESVKARSSRKPVFKPGKHAVKYDI